MKIKELNIADYRHLENLKFDFTYPEGHQKFGQPLEKICLIGQSATGKTSLLELIKESIVKLKKTELVNGNSIWGGYDLEFNGEISYIHKDKPLIVSKDKIKKNNKEFIDDRISGGSIENFIEDDLKLIYISSEVLSKKAVDLFNQNPIDLISLLNESSKVQIKTIDNPTYIYEFSQDVELDKWYSVLFKILDYRKRFTQMASELINKGTIGDANKLNKEFIKWSEANQNPLALFAEKFNLFLNKLNLEVDLVNTEYSVPIKSKINDSIIPISSLSTGTKNLLLSMFSLYEIDTKNSIILLDEPERSLFPDIQIELMNYYKNFAPNAQFIVATHSPFIAASFEPEERFILYFNESGNVALRKGVSPIGDDPNDLLNNDFKVDYYNEFGKKAYQNYINLKKELSQEKELSKKKDLLLEITKLGDQYNF